MRVPLSLARSVGWRSLGEAVNVSRRGSAVVAEDAGDGVEKHGLAVAAWPIDEQQGMLAGVAGQRVAAELLQEDDQVRILLGCLIEESEPARAVDGDRSARSR